MQVIPRFHAEKIASVAASTGFELEPNSRSARASSGLHAPTRRPLDARADTGRLVEEDANDYSEKVARNAIGSITFAPAPAREVVSIRPCNGCATDCVRAARFLLCIVAIKYKFLHAATKRWAFPIAVVLLPGGFVVLAFALFYKMVLPKRKAAADAEAGEPVAGVAGGNFIAAMRMYSARARCELNCARARQNALREAAARPAPAAAAESRQEAT